MTCDELSAFDLYKFALMCAVHERNEALDLITEADKSMKFAQAKLAKANQLLTEIEKTRSEGNK